MISTALTAFISFVSTNIDDIFVLMLFFSQINKDVRIRHIVLGQYLGMSTLTTISILFIESGTWHNIFKLAS